jgi:hypothetical protein
MKKTFRMFSIGTGSDFFTMPGNKKNIEEIVFIGFS